MYAIATRTVPTHVRSASRDQAIRVVDRSSPRERRDGLLLDRVLQQLDLHTRETLVDVGCGGGLLAALAFARGARIAGVDPCAAALGGARRRVPMGEFHASRYDSLPFADDSFDAATAVNVLQRCEQPVRVLREVRRVLKGSGRVALACWADPADCQSATCFDRIRRRHDALVPGQPGAYALAQESTLLDVVARSGLVAACSTEIRCTHGYADLASAAHGLVSGGHAPGSIVGMAPAARNEVMSVLLEPYRGAHGGYTFEDSFRLVLARAGGRRD